MTIEDVKREPTAEEIERVAEVIAEKVPTLTLWIARIIARAAILALDRRASSPVEPEWWLIEHDNPKMFPPHAAKYRLEEADKKAGFRESPLYASPPAPAVAVPEGDVLSLIVDALEDAAAGMRYVRQQYGDLSGVGFDRVQEKYLNAVRLLAAAPQPPATRSYEEGDLASCRMRLDAFRLGEEHWKRQAEAAAKNAALFQQDCAGHVKEKQALRAALAPFYAYAKRELDKTIPRHIQDDDSSPVLGSGLKYEDADAVVVTVGDLKRVTAIRSLAEEARHGKTNNG
jgi:hypothetical protein